MYLVRTSTFSFYSSIVYDTLICRHKLGIECAVLEGDPILMFKKRFSSPWKKIETVDRTQCVY